MKSEKLISLKSVLHITQVSPAQFQLWERLGKVNIKYNTKGEKCLDYNEFKKLAHSAEVKDAAINSLFFETNRKLKDKTLKKDEQFLNEIEIMTNKYSNYIKELEDIHKKYREKLNILIDETPVVASFIIYSKVISLLKMANHCYKNKFAEAFILNRLIDEAIQLAQYFIFSSDTEQGAKHLREWFRENKSPSNSLCRKSIAKFMKNFYSNLEEEDLELPLFELYHNKSKQIHHSFNGIREFYNTQIKRNELKILDFDYGNCSNPRKLFEHVEFFQSSIWTAIQSFVMCFYNTIPLEAADINKLFEYNTKFNEDMNKRRSVENK